MIKCHLSRIMGEKKLKVSDIARATGINRNMISSLYYETARRVELDTIERLCRFLGCGIGDLFELEEE